jgi:hypothetical protein
MTEGFGLIGPGSIGGKWAKWVIKWQPYHILFFFFSIFRNTVLHKSTKR